MEFHAHLSCYEVIGLLGGSWDAAGRKLTVMEAFPCRRAAGGAWIPGGHKLADVSYGRTSACSGKGGL